MAEGSHNVRRRSQEKLHYLPAAFSRASLNRSCLLLKPISRGFGVACISRATVAETDSAAFEASFARLFAASVTLVTSTFSVNSLSLWSVRSAKRWKALFSARPLTTTSWASQFATRWTKGFDISSALWSAHGRPPAVMACEYLALQEGVLEGAWSPLVDRK